MADRNQKTEKPSPRRLKKARREGQIPRSMELVSWLSLFAAVYLIEVTVKVAGSQFQPLFARTSDGMGNPDQGEMLELLGRWSFAGLLTCAPLLLGTMVLGVVSNLAQTGFAPSSKLLAPKFSRVNPFQGVKRLMSTHTIWETAKAVAKVGILSYIAVRAVLGIIPDLIDAGKLSTMSTMGVVAERSLTMVKNVALVGLVLAAADYGFQRRKVMGQLRMTKQEVKEEYRETEGDPQLKGHIRSKQLAMSRNRMMAAVSGASVVVVNPTHFSVALRYEPAEGPPRVVAKGVDMVALRIREEAAKHGVPVVEDVPLARTLHRACELNEVVPTELYDAVAQVLAFIFSLRRAGSSIEGIQRMPVGALK